jgi:8-oxo-dGTP pyrophosphatase MutT (NUDIX family)
LTDANLEYIFRVSPNRPIFLFVLHAYLWIESEERVKSNEFVLSRTDISTVVLLYGDIYSQDLADIEVVLIKEFRTPVNNSDCFVYENPGGSTQPSLFFRDTAIEEVQEETGLRLSPSRLIPLGSRQLVSTLSSHKSHTFVYYLNQDEYLKLLTDSRVHGVESDTERTYIEVTNLAKVLENDLVDWSQLGMIFQAIQTLKKQGINNTQIKTIEKEQLSNRQQGRLK